MLNSCSPETVVASSGLIPAEQSITNSDSYCPNPQKISENDRFLYGYFVFFDKAGIGGTGAQVNWPLSFRYVETNENFAAIYSVENRIWRGDIYASSACSLQNAAGSGSATVGREQSTYLCVNGYDRKLDERTMTCSCPFGNWASSTRSTFEITDFNYYETSNIVLYAGIRSYYTDTINHETYDWYYGTDHYPEVPAFRKTVYGIINLASSYNDAENRTEVEYPYPHLITVPNGVEESNYHFRLYQYYAGN